MIVLKPEEAIERTRRKIAGVEFYNQTFSNCRPTRKSEGGVKPYRPPSHRTSSLELPNFCPRHAAWIVRCSGNDALHAASGIRTCPCRPNIGPSGTFRVGFTVRLAVLNVIGSDVETRVITTLSIFAVLSLTHLGCGADMSGCAKC